MSGSNLGGMAARLPESSNRPVIHRGPIPGTDIGHHWLDARDGNRYGIEGGPGPDGGNKGWAYEIVDTDGRSVDDSMFRYDEIREWAKWSSPPQVVCGREGCGRPDGHDGKHRDEEHFCHLCFAGLESDEHRSRCLIPAGLV